MSKKTFKDKTYRVININGKSYSGKDGFKNRSSDYVINEFDSDYFKGKTVLDLGCASGAILFEILDDIKKGVGVDIDDKKLDIGKFIIQENNIENITLISERLETFMERSEEKFDCVFLLNILHHLYNPYEVLQLTSKMSNDKICIEAPVKGFYLPYARDMHLDQNYEKLDIEDIVQSLDNAGYSLSKRVMSQNQENFIGPDRCVCLFQKR